MSLHCLPLRGRRGRGEGGKAPSVYPWGKKEGQPPPLDIVISPPPIEKEKNGKKKGGGGNAAYLQLVA